MKAKRIKYRGSWAWQIGKHQIFTPKEMERAQKRAANQKKKKKPKKRRKRRKRR